MAQQYNYASDPADGGATGGKAPSAGGGQVHDTQRQFNNYEVSKYEWAQNNPPPDASGVYAVADVPGGGFQWVIPPGKEYQHQAWLQSQQTAAVGVDATNQLQTSADGIRAAGASAAESGFRASQGLHDRGRDAATREAPQAATTTNPGQQQALQRAQGVAPSQGASQALQNFQAPTQGQQDLRSFRAPTEGVQTLRDFAAGPRGPSAAEAQLRIQAARDKRNQLALARSAQGGPAAVARAMRQAQGELARVSAETRGQAALVRATEEDQAQQRNLSALTSAGSLEQQAASTNAGALQAAGQLEQQGAATQVSAMGEGGRQAQAATQQDLDAARVEGELSGAIRSGDLKEREMNLSAELQVLGLNDAQVRFFADLGERARQEAHNARIQAQNAGMNGDAVAAQIQGAYIEQAWSQLSAGQQDMLQQEAIRQGVSFQNQQQRNQWLGQVLGFAGTAAIAIGTAVSDRRQKTAVSPMRGVASDLRASMGYAWKYKNPEKHGKGRHTGAMTQDLERTKNFRNAVRTGPDGVKMVDATRLTMAHHGALSDLQRQIDRLKRAGRKVARRK